MGTFYDQFACFTNLDIIAIGIYKSRVAVKDWLAHRTTFAQGIFIGHRKTIYAYFGKSIALAQDTFLDLFHASINEGGQGAPPLIKKCTWQKSTS